MGAPRVPREYPQRVRLAVLTDFAAMSYQATVDEDVKPSEMLADGSNPEGVDPSPPLNWTDASSLGGIVLANHAGSPPCAKLRYHLSYNKVDYNILTSKQFHAGNSSYAKVPCVRVAGRTVNDSYIICKNLIPALYDCEFDAEWEQKITFGLQLAMEQEIFDDSSQYPAALSNFGFPSCLAYCCCCLLPFSEIATKIRNTRGTEESVCKYGPLRAAVDYLKEFREGCADQKFLAGEEPGAVDVSLFGTLKMWHPGIPGVVAMVNEAQLQQWWERMVDKMPREVLGDS